MTRKRLKDLIILIKGGGEMASGVALRLVCSGFRVCITEIPEPLAVRRGVSLFALTRFRARITFPLFTTSCIRSTMMSSILTNVAVA